MVRDLMLNIAEGDLLTENKSSAAEPVFDVIWGPIFNEDIVTDDTLTLNIIIPSAYRSLITFTNGELIINFTADYRPDSRGFHIRLVEMRENGTYALFNVTDSQGVEAAAYVTDLPVPVSISAAQLLCVDSNGMYQARLTVSGEGPLETTHVCLYSSKKTDLMVGYSDNQAAQLLSLCAPGNSYRYPTTGVGITSYLNSVIEHTRFNDILAKQFEADGKSLRHAMFDNSNCELEVLFTPENEKPDTGLERVEKLDLDFFSDITDPVFCRDPFVPSTGDFEPEDFPDPDPDLPIGLPVAAAPLCKVVCHGDWVQGTRYHYQTKDESMDYLEISEVYHNGQRWQCTTDNPTDEPSTLSSNWIMVMGFLSNGDFENRFNDWTTELDTGFFSIGGRWIWANNNILSLHKDGTRLVKEKNLGNWQLDTRSDDDKFECHKPTVDEESEDKAVRVAQIRNSTISQKSEDFVGLPHFKEDQGVKKAAPTFLTFLYKVIKPGRLTVSFENPDNEGFEDYQPLYFERDMEAGYTYRPMTIRGLWNGTGDLTIGFTGEIRICKLNLSVNRAETLIPI